LVPEIIVPVVHHIPSPGASTATERGFAGPVQERRDSGTLYNMGGREPPHRAADKEIISCLLLNEQYDKMEREGSQ